MAPKTEDILTNNTIGKEKNLNMTSNQGTKDEAIFSLNLIPPLFLISLYVAFLNYLTINLELDKENLPFHKVWLIGPLGFTIFYLTAIKFGVEFMKTRDSFNIKPYIFVYNVYQCLFNIYTVYSMVDEVLTNPWFNGRFWGNAPQPGGKGFRIAYFVWIHYNNKFFELLDTLWMILRKKNNQISLLHCYHHVLMMWAWYYCITIESGGDVYFGAMVNSFIHILMYGYYTLALLGVSCPWKKWITTSQLVQFVLVLTHSCYVLYKKNVPMNLPLAQGFVMINMIILFSDFYAKSYSKNVEKPVKKLE